MFTAAFDNIDPFFFSSRRRHTRSLRDWSSDVCSSDLGGHFDAAGGERLLRFRHEHLGHEQRSRRRHEDRKSTRLNSSHVEISYAVFCLKKKNRTASDTRKAEK